MAMLTVGLDQTCEYYHCGTEASTVHYMISPKAVVATSSVSPTSTTGPETSVTSLATPATQLPSSTVPFYTSPTSASQTTAETQGAESTTDTAGRGSSARNTNNTGAIVGGVMGGLVLLVGAGLAALWLILKHRRRRQPAALTGTTIAEPRWVETENKQMASCVLPTELQADQTRRSPIELPAGFNR